MSAQGQFRTRGQEAALAAVQRWVQAGSPQAVLLAGPARVGKATLALDLAAGLLCLASDPRERPCRSCRPCHLVETGAHQDLHRLAPMGPGRVVKIGAAEDPEPGTVRALLHELARLPVEGPSRVAIVEQAHRLTEDAQNALLKTLEEPPAGAVIVLCADEADRLRPTILSRCAALRLGPVSVPVIEELLGDRGVDAPRAARLARLAVGRPGLALAYAEAPAAVGAREEIGRALLDLLAADRTARLNGARDVLLRATDLAPLADGGDEPVVGGSGAEARLGQPAGVPAEAGGGPVDGRAADIAAAGDAPVGGDTAEAPAGRRSGETPAERRRAARALLEIWADVARDLAAVAAGGRASVHDPALLDDLDAAAARLAPGAAAAFLARLASMAERLEANANPELAVDVLVLAWPRLA